MQNFILILGLLLGCIFKLNAQSAPLKDRVFKDDSISLNLDKRPRTALFLGLLLPGAGQAYNGRWWKIPLAYGAYGFSFYMISSTRKTYRVWNNNFNQAVRTGKKVEVAPGIEFDSRQIKLIRDQARDNKDRAVFLMIGIHGLSALEAFVDAHLKNFNIDDDLGVHFYSPSVPGLSLCFTYNLH
ncbi:MAG TPA: DUF5683 domain-containing protein [Saprospiraceae bacterium]|nr:DUF5683 domain-containing protein [Saprospiraceae bacterium]